ncbi:ATP-dependent DNA helicase RecQ-like [Montipora capricornis]|uniref:ATP-dependent DNA helicase RecQ-like n=1 Tax=Montipora capricornis TaxID=246305 RepID=UPI0035F164EA
MRNPHKVILSPIKDNIRFSVNRADKELNCLNWIVKMLEKERKHCPYGIIFCQTVNDIALVLSYLLTKLSENACVDGETPIAEHCLIGVYYSMTPQTLKGRVKSSFESGIGRARIVIATTSLSMGVDFPSVTYVIHFGPARDLVSHLQEAERAGRDGVTQAHNIIVYLGKHKALCHKEMTKVLDSKECVRKALLSSFGDETCVTPRHNCCNWCHKNCDCCGDGPRSEPLPVFDKPPIEEAYTGPIRTVTDEDRNYLRAALFELKLSLGRQTKVCLFDNSGAISHGFTDKVIEAIVANCNRLLTSRDILQKCFVSSPKLTVIVLEILHECFGDYQPLDIEYKVSSMTESMISPLLMQDTTVDIPFEEHSDWEDDFL